MLTQNERGAVHTCSREKTAELRSAVQGPYSHFGLPISLGEQKMLHLFSTGKITLFTRMNRQEEDSEFLRELEG